MRQTTALRASPVSLVRPVCAGCCQPLLRNGPSRRYLCQSFLTCSDPYPGCLWSAYARYFLQSIGLPRLSTGRRIATNPNSYFSWGPFTGLQSFHHVRAREFARLPDSSHPNNAAIFPDCCRAAETFTTTPITVGCLPRAVVMLADQIRAIVSKWTFTTQDWQPCRLLRSMAGLHTPLPTLRQHPRECLRTARGRCGSLFLHRSGLTPPAPCRPPGAPVEKLFKT